MTMLTGQGKEVESVQKLTDEEKFKLITHIVQFQTLATKVLFTDHCRRQNFCPSLLQLVDRLYTVIHKMQKTRTKVLPSATVSE